MILPTDQVRGLLIRAKTGNDAEAANRLITHFREALSDGGGFDRGLLDDYLMHAFGLIIDGKSADQAFGLKPQKGRHTRPDNMARDVQIAACVEYLTRHKGARWECAIGEVANLFCGAEAGDRLVQDAHAKYKGALRAVDKQFLIDMLPEELVRS